MSKQKIKCNVTSCKYQNKTNCTLDEIKVGNCKGNVTEKEETNCESFQCDNGCSR